MPPPAIAFVNGRILTMDARIEEASVLVIRDGRVAAAGERGSERDHPDAVPVDLGGRTVTPGFIDAHHHLCLASLHPRWADLTGVTDLDTARARIVEAAAREPDTPWVRAAGWDEFATGLALTRRELDDVGLDRPLLVGCFSYHRGVVSSAGLDALGIGRSTPDPPGGRIGRDSTGEADGMLVETAWTSAHAASLAGYDDPDRWGDLIESRAAALLADGVTAVHDAAVPAAAEAVYGALERAGRLPVSVLVMPHGPILSGPDPDRLRAGPPTGEGSERLRVGPVKLFADGGIEIAIDAHVGGHHVRVGEVFPDLADQMALAVAQGYGVAVHAMGNLGLSYALDTWRSVTARADSATGLRIEHVTLAGPDHLASMLDLGVTGVVQPAFVDLLGRNIGDLRFEEATWLPFRDLARSGLSLAASSDAPCHPAGPLEAGRFGATRLTAGGRTVGVEQSLPLVDWLRLYTAGAAAAGGQQAERGRLAPGLRADLVVLDGDADLATTDADGRLAVAETWTAGTRVHGRALTVPDPPRT